MTECKDHTNIDLMTRYWKETKYYICVHCNATVYEEPYPYHLMHVAGGER